MQVMLATWLLASATTAVVPPPPKMNVLMIGVDDLRPVSRNGWRPARPTLSFLAPLFLSLSLCWLVAVSLDHDP